MRSPVTLVLLVILSLVLGAVALQFPELRRYLKIRSM
jgi:hypothetical protein